MHSSSELVTALCKNNATAADVKRIASEVAAHRQSCPEDGSCSFCWYLNEIGAEDAEFMKETANFIETFDKRFDGDIYADPRAVHFSLLCNAARNIYKFIRTKLGMVDEGQVKCAWGCTRRENLTRGSGVGPGIMGFAYFHQEQNCVAFAEFKDSYSIPGAANPCRKIVLDGIKKKTPWGTVNPCVLVVFARSHPNKIYVYNAEFT